MKNLTLNKKTKSIAVMLDLGRTSDNINEETASIFINQLDVLRKKFNAEVCFICMSTHYGDPETMDNTLGTLTRNLIPNIKLGTHFYLCGTYDYLTGDSTYEDFGFNSNKVSVFDSYYVNNDEYETEWFALVDDGISDDVYSIYQNDRPMLICRPSQHEADLKYNSFMTRGTMTRDFDGVIEVLEQYITSIKDLSKDEILEKQKNMLMHLSGSDLSKKIRNRELGFIERYLVEGYADEDDYKDILIKIQIYLGNSEFTELELQTINRILFILKEKFEMDNNNERLDSINELKRRLKIQ